MWISLLFADDPLGIERRSIRGWGLGICVVRYRAHLESRHLAPGTINLRLGAVRRLAYEASDCVTKTRPGRRHTTDEGSQENRRPAGNWLTQEQSHRLWNTPTLRS